MATRSVSWLALLGLCLVLAPACRNQAQPGPDVPPAVAVATDAPLPSGFEEIDLLRLGSAETEVRRAARHLRFTPDDGNLLGAGWGELEVDPELGRGFAWATGTLAEVPVRVLPAQGMELSFACRPLQLADARPQVVTVTLGDAELGRVTLEDALTTYRLPVPEGLLTDDAVLRFHFAWAERPADQLASSSDVRQLAAAFYAIDLDVPGAGTVTDPVAERDGFVQGPGTEVAFSVVVPPDGMLDLGVAPAGDAPEGGATAEVWVRRPGGQAGQLVDLPLRPGSPGRWRVDLAALAGDKVELAFRLRATSPRAAVRWVRPVLLGDRSREGGADNLLLIVVDTLRADHLSCYGGATRTPNMDALAASGVRFERAYSHIPITLPSHATMFTSTLPREHGVRNNGDVLDRRALTLAEVLRSNHRVTAGFVSLGVLSSQYGIAQGFDTYDDSFGVDWWKNAGEVNAEVFRWMDANRPKRFFLWVHYSDPHEPYAPPDGDYPDIRVRLNELPAGSFRADGRTVVLDLELQPGENHLSLLPADSRSSRTLMFRYPSVDPPEVEVALSRGWHKGTVNRRNPGHLARPPVSLTLRNPGPRSMSVQLRFSCEAQQTVAEKRAAYAGEVEYVDRQLGALLQRLRDGGWLDHTLVVLTADHGEGLGDHVQMAHVDQLYEAQTRVPLVLSLPGTLPAGVVVPDVVSHLDLVPTIDHLLRLHDDGVRRGRDLSPLMAGRSLGPAPPLLLETFRPEAAVDRRGVLVGDDKYILSLPAHREELYDVVADPGERHNLIDQRRERVDALARTLADLISASGGEGGAPRPVRELSDEERQRLESLGYIHE